MAKRAAARVVDPLARLSPRVVPGEGPRPCRLMWIAEAPGKEEDRIRRPLVGPSGQLLWSPNPTSFPGIMDALHLPRAQFYITNILKQQPMGNVDPTVAEIAYFRPMLLRELAEVQPEIVIACGGFATRFMLGPQANMDLVHGLPHWSEEFQLPVIPCLHPAAGLHDTDSMPAVYDDYAQAAAFIRGEIGLHTVVDEPTRIEPLPECLPGIGCALGLDTESRVDGSPWCITVAWAPGVAALIRADDSAAIDRLRSWSTNRSRLLFIHNAMYDLGVLRQMGLDLAPCLLWGERDDHGHPAEFAQLIDTMVLTFNRGKIDTQGLKALSYRRLGRKMRSYEDVVGPYQQRLSQTYLQRALIEGYAGAFPVPKGSVAVVDGKVKMSQPWSLVKRLERLLSDADAHPDTDLLKRWSDIDDEVRGPAEALLGPMPQADLSHVPFAEAEAYAVADAANTRTLGLQFWAEHQQRDLIRIASVDHGALPLIERMQTNGMPANRAYFLDLGAEMKRLQAELAGLLEAIVGYPVNPNSSDQVADLVYTVLGLESVKQTPGGKPSTGKKALQHLRAHPLVELILQSREYGKLDDAFCQNIADRVVDGRCYTKLQVTRVKTGRLASRAPNLLAIPTRTKLGNRVRGGFIAPPGHVLATFDLSQVELRILAHLSRDPWMIEIYNRGPEFPKWERDIHVMTAARVWGVNGQDVKKESRTAVKSCNFGIAMGMTGHGLAEQMRLYGLDPAEWTVDRCDKLIEEVLDLWRGVRDYQFQTRSEARRYGFVTSLFGRRFDLPQARCPLSWIREEALRQSHALCIQGGAQDIFKLSSRLIYTDLMPAIQNMGVFFEPLLQVHDETLIETEEGMERIVTPMMLQCLTTATKLIVPMEAGAAWGPDWGALDKG